MKTSIKTSLFYLVVVALLSSTQLQAQSNTFPSSGNVGIGTTSPIQKLDVNGTIGHSNTITSKGANYSSEWMKFKEHEWGNSLILGGGGLTTIGSGESANHIHDNKSVSEETLYLTSDSGTKFISNLQDGWNNRVEAMEIKSDGKIGIGTTTPSHKLSVAGTIKSDKVIVDTIEFPQVAFNGNQSQTILSMPAHSDGAELISEQPNSEQHHVILRMKDNITNDRFRIWFDDYRGSAYDRNPLEVRGDRVLLARDGGNVGIGTSSPSSNLHIKNSNTGAANLIIQRKGYVGGNGGEAGAKFGSLVFKNDHDNDYGAMIQAVISQNGWADHGALDFLVSSGNAYEHVMRINSNKNVGIGTTTPSHKLSVAGTINSEEIIVEENVGADFVFEASYDLPSLQDIEAFIEQNQHLPGIAPASQMIEEGVKVGELQMQLLQKIEELTLYVIEINKENKALRREVEALKQTSK